MARYRRNRDLPLTEDVVQYADQYEFHAMVKLLEAMRPEAAPLGEGFDPTKEALRVRSRVSLSFPHTDIHQLIPTKDEDIPPLLETNFLGIAGLAGPLPTPYTQLLIRRKERKDTAFRDFLDIFNHRLVSLLHLIRRKHWVGIKHERPEDSYIGKTLLSLLGLDGQHLRERLGIQDRSLLYYAGLLWQRPRSSVGLERLLGSFFKVPVRIKQFEGKWMPIPESEQTIIGKTGQYNRLGQTTILNARYWDPQIMFSIHIGPLTLDRHISFLKPGPGYFQLVNLVKYYVGPHKEFRINLILQKDQQPKTKLGYGLALGWTTWLNRDKLAEKDDEQTIFTTLPFIRRKQNNAIHATSGGESK
jgi:type VI secretion system protein ImpH